MATSDSRLASAIVTALKTVHPELTGDAETQAVNDWTNIAKAILDELKDHLEVLPGTFTAPSGGGPVTGTGSVT